MEVKKIIAAGGLVQNEAGELLMIFRRGKWDLPKGKLDEGETIAECAVREVQEETGVQNIQIGQFVGITLHEYFDKYVQADVIKESHWYLMKASNSEVLTPQTEEDITAIKWVDKKEMGVLLKNSFPTIEDIIGRAGL
jgi:8-oxo-dGTP pyrophosphatase MutT (NUDIX family)